MTTFFVTLYKSFRGEREKHPYMNRVGIRRESFDDVKKYLEKEGIPNILKERKFELNGYALEIGSIESKARFAEKQEFEETHCLDFSMDIYGEYTNEETFLAFQKFYADKLAKES